MMPTIEMQRWIKPLKVKDIVFIISLVLIICAGIYAFNIYPTDYMGLLKKADFSFATALCFSLPLLALLIPFRNLIPKIISVMVVCFLLGAVLLPSLSDYQGLIYVFYFAGLILITILTHILTDTRLALPPMTAYIISGIFILTTFILIYFSFGWTKLVAQQFTKYYAFDYVICNANTIPRSTHERVCSNLQGKNFTSLQRECLSQFGGLAGHKKYCTYLKWKQEPEYNFSHFLMKFFDTRSEIGLPSNS